MFPQMPPIDFFEVEIPLPYVDPLNWRNTIREKKFLFPAIQDLLQEEPFILRGGWSWEGLFFQVECSFPMTSPSFPAIEQGDSLELFIDTRGLKEGRFIHKFCHHFFFLPEAVEGRQKGEITRFRGEDRHPYAREEELEFHVVHSQGTTLFQIFLPKEALFGFDPEQSKKLGFSLRINRSREAPLHFPLKTELFKIEEEPTLWASLLLQERKDG